ncbi:MAG TPA: alpha/beta fold hydrolase [Steroidobacteraceae bacterium]|nr:alpha/beta fold hydrolase [Steroidobacteraceae bacterium]
MSKQTPTVAFVHVMRAAMLALLAAITVVPRAFAQVKTELPPPVPGAQPVTVEHIKVHSAAIAGNLEGESADRDVIVFLPPGYDQDRSRRYPVVYALHGFFIGAEEWTHEIHVPQTIEGAFAKGSRPMIVVLPDSKTVYGGSMYSSSATTGDFERFIAHDLVAYMDAHYRTLPNRLSRGLVGHSMGGYGAARIGMKHPEVFGSLYIMSPCCLSSSTVKPMDAATEKAVRALKSPADSAALPWYVHPQLAFAAAWSPDPKKPPLYFDLPLDNGMALPEVLAKWSANEPLAFIDQYIGNLREYRAIAIDVGDQDPLRFDAGKLHGILGGYGITNSFTIYRGTHTSAVAYRFQDQVLPFFGRTLCFERCN